MDWISKFKFRKEMERIESIVYRIKRYLKLELKYYVRRCYKSEEFKPFKLHRNCLPLKGCSFCPDFKSKRVYVSFDSRCYVVSFLEERDFREFIERLCKLYSTACYVYSFCPC